MIAQQHKEFCKKIIGHYGNMALPGTIINWQIIFIILRGYGVSGWDVMDGYEFYEKFKQDKACDHIPVIFLTAKNIKQKKING